MNICKRPCHKPVDASKQMILRNALIRPKLIEQTPLLVPPSHHRGPPSPWSRNYRNDRSAIFSSLFSTASTKIVEMDDTVTFRSTLRSGNPGMASGNSVGSQVCESKDAPRRTTETHPCAEYDPFQTYLWRFDVKGGLRVKTLRQPSFPSKVNPRPENGSPLLRPTSTNGKKCHVEYNANSNFNPANSRLHIAAR